MSSLTEPAPRDPSDLPWIKVSPVLLINLRQYILREERPWNAEERAGLVRQISYALDKTEHWRSLIDEGQEERERRMHYLATGSEKLAAE